MKLKKFLSIALGAVMVTGGVAMASACGPNDDDDAKYKYDITVWVGENTKTLTENLITKFNEENGKGIKFNATVNEQTESNAAGDVLSKPESAPEIFCFAQDQIARLVSRSLLARPAGSVEASVKEIHSANAVAAATVGSSLYAYPLSEDNGFFLYYDKSVFTGDDADKINSIEGIVEVCEANKKKFSFNLSETGAGWYAASFFYAVGAKSEWITDDNGKFIDYDDTYNSPEGMIALKGIQKVVKSEKSYISKDKASDFDAALASAAVISGVWDYETAKDKLGDNLGIAKLPSFTVDGTTYNLSSYLGCKLLGVSPQKDANKAAALSLLAQYLTSEASQLKRFEERGWGPTVKNLQENNEAVKTSPTLAALQASNTVAQGQYPFDWWTAADALGGGAKDAELNSDIALQATLDKYTDAISKLITN